MASDLDSLPPSDTDDSSAQQAPAASSGRATRLSTRSLASTELPDVSTFAGAAVPVVLPL